MNSITYDQIQELQRARSGNSNTNYSIIIEGFAKKGIDTNEIIPRVNVFTFNGWKALGRIVRKGEKGVRITTMIERSKSKKTVSIEENVDSPNLELVPKSVYVFHISQTEELKKGDLYAKYFSK